MVLWFLSAMLETHPSTRAVQRCFVRSNSISEFLHRTHHISEQTRASALCAAPHRMHKARNTHNTPGTLCGNEPALAAFTLAGLNYQSANQANTHMTIHESCLVHTSTWQQSQHAVCHILLLDAFFFVINSLPQLLLNAMSPDPRAGSRLRALISAWTTTTAEASFRKKHEIRSARHL